MRHFTICALALTVPSAAAARAETAYQGLLAADRAFSDRAKGKTLVAGLGAMFDRAAVMASGGAPTLIRGPDAIRARFAEGADNATSSVDWAPVGGGISADGTHGYTYGGMTIRPRGGAPIAQKYLSYWVKRPEGWRVFAYKRAGRTTPGGLAVAPTVMGAGKRADDAVATLKASEQAFSDEAQRIGLRAAFQKWGRPDSVNIGAADTIAVGAQAIGEGVAGPEPTSPVTWAADEALVAGSGDMGVTYGLLYAKQPSAGQPSTIPFFSIWARPKPGDPWRYVAE